MNQPDTLANIGAIPRDQTLSPYQKHETEGRELRIEELIRDKNYDTRNDTGLLHRNGSSDVLIIDASKLSFSPPPQCNGQERFQAMQKWEGEVIDVRGDSFGARLRPIVGDKAVEQQAEIYMEDVDSSDRCLIEPGAVFYWSIGYLDRPSGRVRASVIRFRRLPVWTDQELRDTKLSASRLKNLLDVE